MKPLPVLFLSIALSAFSQTTTFPPIQLPLSQVKQFLSLTDAQAGAILKNNDDYNRFSSQEQQAIGNAQAQIGVEIAKDQLDPLAIGNLYAGIESSCRDLRDRAAATRQQNISILTDAQRAKLNTLNDAMKLAPTILEAESVNLLGSIGSPPYGFTGGSPVSGTFTFGFPACSNQIPTPFFGIIPIFDPTSRFLSQVQQFLGLTDAQVATILQSDRDYNTFSTQEQQAISNAQSEIAIETNKDQLDPLVLGTLYAGIESACRDLRSKATVSQQQNISILTDAQKTRLNTLSDAMKLASTIAEAQNANLLGSNGLPAYGLTGFGSFTSTAGFSVSGVPGCGPARQGDFSLLI